MVGGEGLRAGIDVGTGPVGVHAEREVVPPCPAAHEAVLFAGTPIDAIVELGVVAAIASVRGVVVVQSGLVGLIPKVAQSLRRGVLHRSRNRVVREARARQVAGARYRERIVDGLPHLGEVALLL